MCRWSYDLLLVLWPMCARMLLLHAVFFKTQGAGGRHDQILLFSGILKLLLFSSRSMRRVQLPRLLSVPGIIMLQWTCCFRESYVCYGQILSVCRSVRLPLDPDKQLLAMPFMSMSHSGNHRQFIRKLIPNCRLHCRYCFPHCVGVYDSSGCS